MFSKVVCSCSKVRLYVGKGLMQLNVIVDLMLESVFWYAHGTQFSFTNFIYKPFPFTYFWNPSSKNFKKYQGWEGSDSVEQFLWLIDWLVEV